jgi:hypothetical protein
MRRKINVNVRFRPACDRESYSLPAEWHAETRELGFAQLGRGYTAESAVSDLVQRIESEQRIQVTVASVQDVTSTYV